MANQQKYLKKESERRIRVVKFTATGLIIIGTFGLILGIFFLFMIRPIDTNIGINRIMDDIITMLGITFLILSPVFIVLGWGLWNLKKWARIGAIVTFFLLYVSVLILFFLFKRGGLSRYSNNIAPYCRSTLCLSLFLSPQHKRHI